MDFNLKDKAASSGFLSLSSLTQDIPSSRYVLSYLDGQEE